MEQSTEIDKLAAALSKAQGRITGALKESANPFFKSKYADLASCWDACRGPLSDNGLAIVQGASADDQGVCVTTTLMHESGQWMRSSLRMLPKDGTPQSVGSCLTYGRRYGLTAMIGIAQIDDDANAASGRTETRAPEPRSVPDDCWVALADAAKLGSKELRNVWKEQISDETRSAITASHAPKWETLKALAVSVDKQKAPKERATA